MSGPALLVDGGGRIDLDLDRWRGEPDDAEAALLATLEAPVLDVGCGPGRAAAALAQAGRLALGIDPSAAAAVEAGRRCAPVLRRSVFVPLPAEGRWATALLFDGNIGIGGDPVALLCRLRQVLRPGGAVVAELDPDGGRRRLVVRVRVGGEIGPRFPWATVGVDAWAGTATEAGLEPGVPQRYGRRWFATAHARARRAA
ncbi:MAG: methyltransferase domain-containing protein [Chloroflexi bacterium]|nr:methyltransferase domain-containing protein [Chloroflexota bacterium]